MMKWTAIQWLKTLTILLLVFLNGYLFYKLMPFIGGLLHFVLKVLFPFIIAAMIAYLLHPIVERLSREGMPRVLAILIIYALFFGITGVALFKGVPVFLSELRGFDDEIASYAAMYHNQMDHLYHTTPEVTHDHFNRVIAKAELGLKHFIGKIVAFLTWMFQSFFTLLIIPFLAFYFLKDVNGIKKGCSRLVPRKWRKEAIDLFRDMDQSLGSYIRGQLYVCAILSVIAAGGLWLLKVPYPLIFGTFIGATDIIPYFGPLIGAVPVVLLAATISVRTVIFVLLLVGLVQLLEGNVVEPLIVGKTVDIHPVYIMLSLTIGGELAGVIGMLFAVPIFVVGRVFIHHLRDRYGGVIDKQD